MSWTNTHWLDPDNLWILKRENQVKYQTLPRNYLKIWDSKLRISLDKWNYWCFIKTSWTTLILTSIAFLPKLSIEDNIEAKDERMQSQPELEDELQDEKMWFRMTKNYFFIWLETFLFINHRFNNKIEVYQWWCLNSWYFDWFGN